MGWAARANKSAETSASNGHRKPRVITFASRRDERFAQHVPLRAMLLGATEAPSEEVNHRRAIGAPIGLVNALVLAAFAVGRGVEKSTTPAAANRGRGSDARVQQMKSPIR